MSIIDIKSIIAPREGRFSKERNINIMTSRAYLKGRDNSKEPTSFGLYLPNTNAGNLDAHIAALDALQTAVNAVCDGVFDGKQLLAVDVPAGEQSPDTAAQREGKWRVTYSDNVTPIGNGSFEIGMYSSDFIDPGTQNMIAGAERTALVNAIQGTFVSRLGNAITVTGIYHVGRNT